MQPPNPAPRAPHVAVAKLALFATRELALTQEGYDLLFDEVLEFLEEVNDNRHLVKDR